jgi:hypothetical protein
MYSSLPGSKEEAKARAAKDKKIKKRGALTPEQLAKAREKRARRLTPGIGATPPGGEPSWSESKFLYGLGEEDMDDIDQGQLDRGLAKIDRSVREQRTGVHAARAEREEFERVGKLFTGLEAREDARRLRNGYPRKVPRRVAVADRPAIEQAVQYNYRNYVKNSDNHDELLEERRAACDKAIYKIKGGCKRRCNKILGNKQDCQGCLEENRIEYICKGPVSKYSNSSVYSDEGKTKFSNEDKNVQRGINRAISEAGDKQMKEAVDRLRGETWNERLADSREREAVSQGQQLVADNAFHGREATAAFSFPSGKNKYTPPLYKRDKEGNIIFGHDPDITPDLSGEYVVLGGGKKKKKNKRTKKRKRSKKKRTKKR